MTELSDLYALRDMLNKADVPFRELFIRVVDKAVGWTPDFDDVAFFQYIDAEAWTDAAEALRQRLLPGWRITVTQHSDFWAADLLNWNDGAYSSGAVQAHANAPTEPLAILKALVAALISTKEQPR